ncbi:hypothetical protein K461DRAFT_273215 [Myriangium duriaei CBS 260.36]|uniref:EH domain-containing protein n=1 Tax=Myriangium duriaei CBS 260.36 TaxID=1168546 RepID=A0A9P4ML80_9PEZI|nr:hypothetical protein K461DRAFT_273215 [Myriangium duriaei CBS 260.36]
MLFKTPRSGILVLAVLIFILVAVTLSWSSDTLQPPVYQWTSDTISSLTGNAAHKQDEEKHFDDSLAAANPVADMGSLISTPPPKALSSDSDMSSHKSGSSSATAVKPAADPDLKDYNVVFSQTTKDHKYFRVKFGDIRDMNPNFIPHPTLPETWYMVSQRWKGDGDIQTWFTELVCEAVFKDGVLQCRDPPLILPVAATQSGSGKCDGDGAMGYFVWIVGPHDARVFQGPDRPFIIYGSNSAHNCFGLWAQDFRMLVSSNSTPAPEDGFRFPVDLQRPPPYGAVEKNWFMFWDRDNQAYLHHDIMPHRVFAKLNKDGSVGPDLGPTARASDDACMKAYAPKIAADESIHQATNSLAVTMCNRSDPACKRTQDNTFILHIFQHKIFRLGHGMYEPYVMLYNEKAPFGLHAISSKPFWINGRKKIGELEAGPKEHSEMIYVTSVNWKSVGNTYHGFLDDVVMLGFGIEDSFSGGIDLTAGDLIGELSLCLNV